jgi:CheY-like chemotaxis protein/HPt (histidine-containing phosphotransfer) domain-containing protein
MNEMTLRESASGEISAYGRAIESAGNTLLAMINNILDMSRIESGKMKLNEEPFGTAGLIGELYVMAHKTAARKGLHFTVDADEKLPSELYGDKIRIKQIALNFLSNALKYTEKGRVTLRLGNGKPGGAGFVLSISVEDTGIGIREERKAELFEMFSRLDLPKYKSIEGSGLGLAISKELTELMGGGINVESVPEQGSVFTAAIPLKVHNAAPMGKWEGEAALMIPQGSKGGFTAPDARILVVDDNEENVRVILLLLGRAGIRVDTAASGMRCIEMALASPYHVILMDYRMPGMDGIETLKLLREKIEGFNTPLIAVSADASAGAEKRFLDAGFAAYLAKPILPDDLDEALLRVLPERLVQKNTAEEGGGGSLKLRTLSYEGIIAAMAGRGVSLEKGLQYFSRHFAQYRKTAALFLENHPKRQEEMRRLLEKRDWEAVKFCAHSLKSSARVIGAEELGGTAARLEKYCADGRDRLIEKTAGLLFAEWEEAERGIRLLMGETESGEESHVEETDLIEKLRGHLRGMNLTAAKKDINALLNIADEKEQAVFIRIREQIQELEYGKAEKILLEHLKQGSGKGSENG